jgi:hypothetical protein
MISSEQTEFNTLFDQVCAGLGAIPSDARRAAYWKGLSKMSLIQFSRVVDFCLSDEGPDKFPTVPGVWKLWRVIAAAARSRSMPPPPPPEELSKGLQHVNGMFLKYLLRRRVAEGFKGDINMPGRRAACLDLGAWLDRLIREDLAPNREELQSVFDKAMVAVKDAPGALVGA